MFACEKSVDLLMEAARLESIDLKMVVFGKHGTLISLHDAMSEQNVNEVINFKPKTVNPNDLAWILFSSGTTGMPKGVAHSYESLFTNVYYFVFMPYCENRASLWYSSLYWITGTLSMFQALIAGSTRILHANFDPVETCQVINKYKVCVIIL